MKKLIILAAMCAPFALLTQCGKRLPTDGYLVEVAVDGTPTHVLMSYAINQQNHVDTAVMRNGAFVFEGTAVEPMMGSIVAYYAPAEGSDKIQKANTPVVLEPGVISVALHEDNKNAVVGGTPSNDEMNQWVETFRPVENLINATYDTFKVLPPEQQTAERPALDAKMDEFMGQMRSMAKEYVAAHPDSWFALQNLFNHTFDDQNADQAQASLDGFSERLRASKLGQERQKQIDMWRTIQIGGVAPDFAMADTAGVEVRLSDLRGKWVLVDFWASWCGPCRGENPNVVAVYHEFRDRGFTVLGVSLDSKREPWLKAIADDKLEWTQLSDLAGWKNEAAALYSVKSIPANFLLNPEGVIVARNLREGALREELAKQLAPAK